MTRIVLIFILLLPILVSCASAQERVQAVGLLLSHPIDDQEWNGKGYQGMLKVQSALGVDIIVKEDIRTNEQVEQAISSFDDADVNLVFGHGAIYADFFMNIKDTYPDIHFVSFNGEVEGDNITSLHFEGYPMGYFAGMLAAKKSQTGEVGVIGAFPYQPEVAGFADGAKAVDPSTNVSVEFVNSWVDDDRALALLAEMKANEVDVFYPAGDGYHQQVIEEVKRSGLFAIGYLGDQLDLGGSTVLTSTIQNVEGLYEYVAETFQSGALQSGNMYFDFEDGLISLGEYSQEVPEDVQIWLDEHITAYKETGKLPYQ
ncbi:BMP family ABC transporter substrate-binding protein [Paenalkalicoccus suaedae]|uniref:BMP family ABC transporter substrate-binding protein n=1 Tax=Paenalkalicoccus suaedae TaxID=2592382 RepID=A0A859FG20_9BACI|nr:BMP family ABC transporter substrate-binding protein [Paenalkalicoccus suaedae]QKS71780.1 BMP family ABC transporter substrate-binding protein [Paenalkalicoccus suaedae]